MLRRALGSTVFLAIALLLIVALTVSASIQSSGLGFNASSMPCDGNDPFTKIMLQMQGANGGTSFPDSNAGGSAHTWTAHSATTSSTQIKFGVSSLSVGSTGWIDTPDSTDFTLGGNPFTFDFWFYRSGGDGTRRIAWGQGGTSAITDPVYIELDASNHFKGTVTTDGTTATSVTGTTAITSTGWNFGTFLRTGNILRLFLNGIQEGGDVAFSSAVFDSSDVMAVGRAGSFASLQWNGFISTPRLSLGIARWNATNFTPPAQPYCQ